MPSGDRRKTSSYRGVFAGLLSRLTQACQGVYGDRLVSLAVFGSVGRDRPRPESDVDLILVIERPPEGRLARVEEFAEVERKLEPHLAGARQQGVDTRLSPIIRSPEEMAGAGVPFTDMALEARILYDRAGFFAGFVEQLEDRLRKAGAKRVVGRGPVHWRVKRVPGEEGVKR